MNFKDLDKTIKNYRNLFEIVFVSKTNVTEQYIFRDQICGLL